MNYGVLLSLIVFTQVNIRPTLLFYNVAAAPFYSLMPIGILQPSILFPFYMIDYQLGATTASKISHEYI